MEDETMFAWRLGGLYPTPSIGKIRSMLFQFPFHSLSLNLIFTFHTLLPHFIMLVHPVCALLYIHIYICITTYYRSYKNTIDIF